MLTSASELAGVGREALMTHSQSHRSQTMGSPKMGLAVMLLLCQITTVVAMCCDTVDILGPSSIQSAEGAYLGKFNQVATLSVVTL